MSDIVVITFDDPNEAGRVRNSRCCVATLRKYEVSVYHSSLPPEAEEQLRWAMEAHKKA